MSGQPPYISTAPYNYSRDIRYASCTNPDTAMAYNRRPSMLANYVPYSNQERASMHPYYLAMPSMQLGPHVDETPKSSRYSAMNTQMIAMPIDVKKEQVLYQPTTEAISPIHEEMKIDSHTRDTTVIRNTISKLNSDIETTVKKLQRAQLSQNEIRRQADRTAVEDEETEIPVQTNGSQTLIEKILHENRKLAEESQKSLNQVNNNMDFTIPLYQQPNDLESIENIRTQYMNVMKNRLIKLFRKSRERYMLRTKFVSEQYDQTYQEWQKSIEKEEKSILSKDASTYRDTFEKTFPELRKAREDKEKKQLIQNSNDNSSSSSVSSNDSPTGQQTTTNGTANYDQEMQEDEEKMRKSSVVPPMLFDRWQRKHQYFNQNGLVKDETFSFYKEQAKLPYWSPEERSAFIEKFTQSPKNFGYISSFLENKTTEQCVQFYYMTKNTENYKNLLRKQAPIGRRRPKNTTTTLTTTTVTSSTTIETTLVTKVSSNTIVSSTSQKILGSRRENERSSERIDQDEERRDNNANDANEEKRANKNRCQFLSCTSARKKTRKNRLRVFPTKWAELTEEQREEIRRVLQIPSNVQRCCSRCYGNLIGEVCQRHNSQLLEEEDEDDEDDEENNEGSVVSDRSNTKTENDDWKSIDIDAFRKAFEKYDHDWGKVAESLGRNEQSCRTFYLTHQKVLFPDDPADDDNGSISDVELSQIKSNRHDERNKLNINEDSSDSTHPMIIDEGDEIQSIHDGTAEKINQKSSSGTTSNLTTINSLVEKEITRTLHETELRLASQPIPSDVTPTNEKPFQTRSSRLSPTTVIPPPPALVIPVRPQSPNNMNFPLSTNTQTSLTPSSLSSKGSIMRGTPISPSMGPHKPIPIDPTAPQTYPFPNQRNEHQPMKSPKVLDRSHEQQYLLQQQHQNANYMTQYSRHHSGSAMYMQQQLQHQQQNAMHQQHRSSSAKADINNPNRLETLKTDLLTSKYMANPAPHSTTNERHLRTNLPDHRVTRPASPPHLQNLPQQTANPSISSAGHPHHSATTGNYLQTGQIFGQSSMYPQELMSHSGLPYAAHYGTMPSGAPVLFDSRLMQDYAAAEQQKLAARSARHLHPSHAPVDPAVYSSHLQSRHLPDDMGYQNPEYITSPWRAQNMPSNPLMKGGHGSSDNPMLKLNDLSRHSASRLPISSERDNRSPDDSHPGHHRLDPSRSGLDVSGAHFSRSEASSHHKMSHDKNNSHLHYIEHQNDPNALACMRSSLHMPKHQANIHSSHRSHPNPSSVNRPVMTSSAGASMPGNNGAGYMMHNFQHQPVGQVSPHRQHTQVPSHHLHHPPHFSSSSRNMYPYESLKPKDQISIQEYMNKSVDEFVRSNNYDHKHPNAESMHELSTSLSSSRGHLSNNSDQPILIDVDDDSNPIERNESESNLRGVAKSNMDMEMCGRRRVSSIKKILSNQALEKQQYDDINQQVQNSSNNSNASKLCMNADQSNLERSNSTGGRTKSRNSITMRMLMGENEAYVDGKEQRRSPPDEMGNKRPLSSERNCEEIEYLIRDELVRKRPNMHIPNDGQSVFSKPPINQQQGSSSKRMKTTSRDDDPRPPSNHSLRESPGIPRDPFALQPQSKSSYPSFQSSSNTAERHWQTLAQQQYHQSPSVLTSRSSRPTGSITQGSPISSSIRLATDQSSYTMATNNHLINPRYPCYVNKNEQSQPYSRQSSSSPHEHSPKHKLQRRSNQTISPIPDFHSNLSSFSHSDQQTTGRSPSANPMPTNTPPSNIPVSSHSLKKRLITEYELEQQRHSPNTSVSTPLSSSSPSSAALSSTTTTTTTTTMTTKMTTTRMDFVEKASASSSGNNSRVEVVDNENKSDSHDEPTSELKNNDSDKST